MESKNTEVNRRHFMFSGIMGLVLAPLASSMAQTSKFLGNKSNAENSCSIIPSETDGPYPAHSDDRGVNVLKEPGIVRSDITTSLATDNYPGNAVAHGLPLNLRMRIVDAKNGCLPLAGYAVYVWHCDNVGDYSMYNDNVKTDTYLRGVQVTDSEGWVEFQSIYPGCYDGRSVHVHFDIFKSLDVAVNNAKITKTSQLTFPESVSEAVYKNNNGYEKSIINLKRITLETDNVFSDGYEFQMATIDSGSYLTGYTTSLSVAVDPDATETIGGGRPPGGGGRPGGPGPRPPGKRLH